LDWIEELFSIISDEGDYVYMYDINNMVKSKK